MPGDGDDFRLTYSNRCPECESEALYDGEVCRRCKGVFEAGDEVVYGNELGVVEALSWDQAFEILSGGECGIECGMCSCGDDIAGADVDAYMRDHVRVRLNRGATFHPLRTTLCHREAWTPPPMGQGHPVYEEVLDELRGLLAADVAITRARRALTMAEERREAAWERVRPALDRLVQATRDEASGAS